MIANEFERILDECVDRLSRGESLEHCLAAYPEHAKQLEPLLQAMIQTKAAYSFSPSADTKREARQRFYTALDRLRQPSLWERILARRLVWATAASLLVLAVIGYFALNAAVFRGDHLSPTVIASPNPNGNFVFLVSDDVNAIADFTNVNVTISKVSLLNERSSKQWVEFVPETKEFDLALLPGEKTQELWRGDVPEGQYTKAVIYVTTVQGTLKATGVTMDIKLPSNKLQISKPFQVSAGNVTSLTYDLTVVHAGNAKGGGKYLLKPQVGESGASEKPAQDVGNSQEKPAKDKGNSQDKPAKDKGNSQDKPAKDKGNNQDKPAQDKGNSQNKPAQDKGNSQEKPAQDKGNSQEKPTQDKDNSQDKPPQDKGNSQEKPAQDKGNSQESPTSSPNTFAPIPPLSYITLFSLKQAISLSL